MTYRAHNANQLHLVFDVMLCILGMSIQRVETILTRFFGAIFSMIGKKLRKAWTPERDPTDFNRNWLFWGD